MPNDAKTLAAKYAGHLRYLDLTRNKMEYLLTEGIIVRRDVEQVYMGIYLDCMTSFESMLEDLFVGLLSGRFGLATGSAVPLVRFRNRQAIRPLLYGSRPYADWLPYNRTEELANRFFRNGGPFTQLDDNDKGIIRQCSYIRNAIAHRSPYSDNIFKSRVIGNQNLMAREKSPSGYLRSIYRHAPVQTRYEYFALSLAGIARKLCS